MPSLDGYKRLLGVPPEVQVKEFSKSRNRAAIFDLGGIEFQITQSMDPDGRFAAWIAQRGHEGLHHICYAVDDIDAALAEAQANGAQLKECAACKVTGSHVHPEGWVAFLRRPGQRHRDRIYAGLQGRRRRRQAAGRLTQAPRSSLCSHLSFRKKRPRAPRWSPPRPLPRRRPAHGGSTSAAVRAATADAVDRHQCDHYSRRPGIAPLCQAVAAHLTALGVQTQENDVVISGSVQEARYVALRALAVGKTVYVSRAGPAGVRRGAAVCRRDRGRPAG